MSMILIFPFLLMWSLGGFTQGSYVFIWAFFAPIAALIHDKHQKSQWLFSFLALLILSSLLDKWLIANIENRLSFEAIEVLLLLNISAALSGIYFLLRYFIQQNEKNADSKLNSKQLALKNNTKQLYDNISYLESYKNNIDHNLIVTRTNIDGVITFANENFYKITGFSQEEVIGNSHNIIRSKNTPIELFDDLWQTILHKKTWHGTIENVTKDGTSYWIDSTISPILNKDDEIVEFIAIRHNVTRLVRHKEELEEMLYSDSLTQLPNRNALLRDIKRDTPLCAMLINIDRFSHINNLYGDRFGNKVLIEFSALLKKTLQDKEEFELYRLSGDEFVITAPKTESQKIEEIAKALLKNNNQELLLSIDEQSIALNLTIGLSHEENSALIATTSMALTVARKESKNILLYSEDISLNDEYQNNLKWINEIKDAIEEDRITMFYQPIIDNSDHSKKKYETLIRLIDREGNVITPYHFLEIAKKAKLYKKLTKIVIKKSFAAFKENDYEFSLNITIDDILDDEITAYIIQTLQDNRDVAKRAVFEIVESESIENFDAIEHFITQIKAFGCKIAIDDFGTGYSNFEHLMRLQADFIKIDGSIIKEITTDKRSALITSVIVAFAKEMNIKTIGEYVENKEIHDKLVTLGVNKSQGYYFDKPQSTLDTPDTKSKK